MKKKVAVIVLFCALLILPTVVWLCGGEGLHNAVTLDEKRNPAPFPSADLLLRTGKDASAYFAGIEAYYNDRLPFRAMMTLSYQDLDKKTNMTYQTLVKGIFNAVHTHHYVTVTVEPTCGKEGYTEKVCICKDTIRLSTTPALEHHYVETVVAPTCQTEGYTLHECTNCGDRYQDDPTDKTGHTYETVKVLPTCEADGYLDRTCTGCGKHYREHYGDALGHDYLSNDVWPTCTQDGYTEHVCSRCGDTYRSAPEPATGHAWGDWTVTKEATAETVGVRKRICGVCGEEQTREIPLLKDGHVHAYTEKTVPPSCKTGANGYTEYVCSCGDTYTGNETTPTHSYTVVTVEPTCIKSGSHTYTCSECGDTYTEKIPSYGHDYGDVTVIKPTCEDKGYEYSVCARCGSERKTNFTPALGHAYGDWVVVKKPTKKANGLQTRTCAHCGNVLSYEIPKLADGQRTGYTSNGKTKLLIGGAIDVLFNPSTAAFTNQGDILTNNQNDWYLYIPGITLRDYQGTEQFSAAQTDDICRLLARIDNKLKSEGRTFVFTICPNKEKIYSEYMDPAFPVFDKARCDYLMQAIAQNTSVKTLYPIDDLLEYKKTYQLWFKHDTHWNAAGGYLWAMNLLETIGMDTVDLYDVPLTSIDRSELWSKRKQTLAVAENLISSTIKGSYDHYGDISLSRSDKDTDYVIDYKPDVSLTVDSYFNLRCYEGGSIVTERYFTNPEYTNFVLSSTAKNGKSICIVGDSFRRALIDPLARNFSKLSSYHINILTGVNGKTYKNEEHGQSFVDNVKTADVLVVELIERSVDCDGLCAYLNEILKILGE